MVRLDPPFTATRARVLNANEALLQSTSPPARVNHQAARTKVSPTREKVASKTSAPNNKALQAAPRNNALQAAHRNNDSHLPLRLRHASHLWSFASRMTQRIITKGLTRRWSVKPPKLSLPSHSTSRGDLAPHIKDMLQKGIILKVPLQPCFASPLFLVPKSSGGQRVIIDLSPLSKHILCPTFRMQDATKLRSCIPCHCFFTSIDLSEAFHHIPIHPRFQKFLSFFHDNNLYFFEALPFGINLGLRIFTKVITEVPKLLHLQNIHASVYIDQVYIDHARQTKTATTLLTNLSLSVNCQKSYPDLSTTNHLSRGTILRRKPLSPSQSSEHRQIPVLNLPHLPVVHDQQKTSPAPAGNSQFPGPVSSSEKTPPHHPSCPIIQEKIASPHSSTVEESPPLDAGREEPLSTSSHFLSSSNCHLLDRRIPFRLRGSLLLRSLRLGMLDTRGETPAH